MQSDKSDFSPAYKIICICILMFTMVAVNITYLLNTHYRMNDLCPSGCVCWQNCFSLKDTGLPFLAQKKELTSREWQFSWCINHKRGLPSASKALRRLKKLWEFQTIIAKELKFIFSQRGVRKKRAYFR